MARRATDRSFDSPSEIAAAFKALVGVHRPTLSERRQHAILSITGAIYLLVAAAFIVFAGFAHLSPALRWFLGVCGLLQAALSVWGLAGFVRMQCEFTDRSVTYSSPPSRQRWWVPIEDVATIQWRRQRGTESLVIRARTGGARWLRCTQSMRDALAAAFSQP